VQIFKINIIKIVSLERKTVKKKFEFAATSFILEAR